MDAHGALAAFCERERPLWSDDRDDPFPAPRAAGATGSPADGFAAGGFPEWAAIEGVAAGDSDHAYTIDEHTLLAIERISDLREIADPARQRFGQLFSEIEDPALLLFALLFHKMPGSTGGSEAAARIQMPASDRELSGS